MFEFVARLRREDRGFTLIELLIVIVILGILAGIVLFAVAGVTDRGNAAACKSDRKTIEVAVEAYRAKNGDYPPNLDTLTTAPNQFLRPDPNLSGNTKEGDGYTITYDPGTGEVTATGACS